MSKFLPTNEEELIALAYVNLRVECTGSYLRHCEEYVREAIRRIIAVCYKYSSPVSARTFTFDSNPLLRSEIDSIINWLIDQLESSIEDLVEIAQEEGGTDLLAWLDTRDPQHTMDDRLRFYASQWEDEVEAHITANFLLDSTEMECEDNVLSSIEHPYDSDWWKQAVLLGGALMASEILRNGGVSYGRGKTNVGLHMLQHFGQRQIEGAFGRALLDRHEGATEFRSKTFDTNACRDCIDHEYEGWRPIDECPTECRWHTNCRCIFLFR